MQRSLILLLCSCALAACKSTREGPANTKAAPPAAAGEASSEEQAAHAAALAWLANEQQADGSWPVATPGGPDQVGITGLAVLALQSGDSTMAHGPHARPIARGVQWLMSQQDSSGVLGGRPNHSFVYDHAIGTLALCTTLKRSPSEHLREVCQGAVEVLLRMRNPYSAWRYDFMPGDNDTSVTGWAVEALVVAREAGLEVDAESFVGARSWIDEATDPKTARVGYDSIGSSSSRIPGLNDDYPTSEHEAMTASGMVTRMNVGEKPSEQPLLARHAQLLLRKLPEWEPNEKLVDEYYWYFGSIAMRRLGGTDWAAWRQSMLKALLEGQSRSGTSKGSWEPAGPWAYAGGRVYSTALNALSLSATL